MNRRLIGSVAAFVALVATLTFVNPPLTVAAAPVTSLQNVQVNLDDPMFERASGPADPTGCDDDGVSVVPFTGAGPVSGGGVTGRMTFSGSITLAPQTGTVNPMTGPLTSDPLYGFSAKYGLMTDVTGTFTITNGAETVASGTFTGPGKKFEANIGSCYGVGAGNHFGYTGIAHGSLLAVDANLVYSATSGENAFTGRMNLRQRQTCVSMTPGGSAGCGYGGNAVFFTTGPTVQRTLTVSPAGSGSGTVTSQPAGISCPGTCTATFADGSLVTLTAVATPGDTFTGFTGACSGAAACGLDMSADRAVTATFTAPVPQHTLTVTTSGTGVGSVTSQPAGISCPGTCTLTVDEGTQVTLTATAAEGSTSSGLTGACTGAVECTVTVGADSSVDAAFASDPVPDVIVWEGLLTDLWRGSLSGPPTRFLTGSVYAPDVSPDGTRVVFASDRGGQWDLWLVDIDGTDLTQLTSDTALDQEPAWSPDGSMIVYSSSRAAGDDYDLWTIAATGGTPQLLFESAAYASQPAWSPDGSTIAFLDGQRLATISSTGSGHVLVGGAAGLQESPSWAPDGSQLAFSRLAPSAIPTINLINLDGTGETTVSPAGEWSITPDWSADGTKLAFTIVETADYSVWVMAADGTDPVKISDTTQAVRPSWSGAATPGGGGDDGGGGDPGGGTGIGGGGRVTYSRSGDIWTARPDGTDLFRVTRDGWRILDDEPAWSPDGTQITFIRQGRGFVVDADGTDLVMADSMSSSVAYDVDWGPDGQVQLQRYLTSNYFRARTTAGGSIQRTSPFLLDSPSFSPDGATLLVGASASLNGTEDGIRRVSYLGNSNSRVQGTSATDREPAWSPDGTKMAFVSTASGSPQVMVADIDGSNRSTVTPGSNPAWSPDGTQLVFIAPAGNLSRVTVDGSATVAALPIAAARNPDWSGLGVDGDPTGDDDEDVSDGGGGTGTGGVDDPWTAVDDTYLVQAGTTLTVAAPGVLDNDGSARIPAYRAAIVPGQPNASKLSLIFDGRFTFTSSGLTPGLYSYQYTATSVDGDTDVATVTFSVADDTNAAPTAPHRTITVRPDVIVRVRPASGLLRGASDSDGFVRTAALVARNNSGQRVTVAADGSFTFSTAGATEADVFTFTYRVTDNRGSHSSPGTVTVRIDDGNSPPIARDDTWTVVRGETLRRNVSNNDSDPDNNIARVVLVGTFSAAGRLSMDRDGNVEFPSRLTDASREFRYYLVDSFGDRSNTATVRITATPNKPPVARDNGWRAKAGSTFTLLPNGVLGNDFDPEGGQLTRASLVSIRPAGATLRWAGNGGFTFTAPRSDRPGKQYFITYVAVDEEGLRSAPAVARITIDPAAPPPNRAPIARADSATVRSDEVRTIDVLRNDSDPDRDVFFARLVATSAPNGFFSLDRGGDLTINPLLSHHGQTFSLTYVAIDFDGATSAKVTVTVTVTKPRTVCTQHAVAGSMAEGAAVLRADLTLKTCHNKLGVWWQSNPPQRVTGRTVSDAIEDNPVLDLVVGLLPDIDVVYVELDDVTTTSTPRGAAWQESTVGLEVEMQPTYRIDIDVNLCQVPGFGKVLDLANDAVRKIPALKDYDICKGGLAQFMDDLPGWAAKSLTWLIEEALETFEDTLTSALDCSACDEMVELIFDGVRKVLLDGLTLTIPVPLSNPELTWEIDSEGTIETDVDSALPWSLTST